MRVKSKKEKVTHAARRAYIFRGARLVIFSPMANTYIVHPFAVPFNNTRFTYSCVLIRGRYSIYCLLYTYFRYSTLQGRTTARVGDFSLGRNMYRSPPGPSPRIIAHNIQYRARTMYSVLKIYK